MISSKTSANAIALYALFGLLVPGSFKVSNGQKVEILPKDTLVAKFINDSYFATCTVDNDSSSAEWINPWGQKISSNSDSRIWQMQNFGVDLFLNQVRSQDEGLYSCVGPKGNRATFNLTVIRPIVFDESFREQTATEGQNFVMKCIASGQSQPKYLWKVDQRNPREPKFKIRKEGLIIYNVTESDRFRHYMCRAIMNDSPLPDIKTLNVTLKVRMKPRFTENMTLVHGGVLQEWAKFICLVRAEPPAKLEWIHRGQVLDSSDETVIFDQENNSTLHVLVQQDCFGDYICQATNELGKVNATFSLVEAEKSLKPTILIEDSATSATVSISVEEGNIGLYLAAKLCIISINYWALSVGTRLTI